MSNISNPTAFLAVVAALVLSGIGASLPLDNAAAAANCAAAPSAAAPQGQHWYYHFDRATHRKCWYLHATVALAHHAAAEPAAADSEVPADPAPAQLPATPAQAANPDPPAQTDAAAPPSANNPDSAQPGPASAQAAPRVTVLTVKTVPEPFVNTTAPAQQRAPDNVAAPPTAQPVPPADSTVSAKPPDSIGQAPPPAPPEVVRQDATPAIDTANAVARKRSGEMLLLLALALGIAAGVVAIISKMVGPYRTPRFADHPDAAWIRYRTVHRRLDEEAAYDEQDIPFVDPQPEHGLADPQDHWTDQSPAAPAGFPPAAAEPPSVKDIELALRILRQARQSGVA